MFLLCFFACSVPQPFDISGPIDGAVDNVLILVGIKVFWDYCITELLFLAFLRENVLFVNFDRTLKRLKHH